MRNNHTPEVRFVGFTGDWEQHKLGEAAKVIDPHPSHRAPAESESGIPFIGIGDVDEEGNINYKTSRLVDKKIYDEHNIRYDLSKNSIGIGRVASLGKVIRLRNDIGKYAVSPTIAIIQFDKNSDNDFMYATMNTPNFQKQFRSLSNGSTRQSVGMQSLRSLETKVSKNFDEQIKIGLFFKKLDHAIIFHQQELTILQQTKQGFLQKMFPKKGESMPEIQFPGFTKEWNQIKAGQIFNAVSDKNHPNLPMLSASQEKGMVYRKDIGIDIQYDKKTSKNYKRVRPGQFVMHLRSFQGGFAFSNIEGITSPAYTVLDFISKDAHYGYFWKSILASDVFIKRLETVTYGIRDGRSISFRDFSALKFMVPSFNEQVKIGNLFKEIDKIIALQKKELEALQETKKAFLQKMFV